MYVIHMPSQEARGAALGRVFELTVLLGEDMAQGLAREGLTGPRAHLLWELQQRGPSTQQALAGALGVTPRNVTGLVDGLVATGFVSRQPHPTDRRATLVTFTEHGAAVAEGFERGRAEVADLLFADMPDDQFDAFVKGVDVVVDRLRAALAEAGEGHR
jgi:DNA-binding MarR family transcriptional regulator